MLNLIVALWHFGKDQQASITYIPAGRAWLGSIFNDKYAGEVDKQWHTRIRAIGGSNGLCWSTDRGFTLAMGICMDEKEDLTITRNYVRNR